MRHIQVVTPKGIEDVEEDEDEDIPYDGYAFEIGFVWALTEDAELAAVLGLARRLKRGNISVMAIGSVGDSYDRAGVGTNTPCSECQ